LAAALLRLAAMETDVAMAKRWQSEAVSIVESLWRNYSSRGTAEPSILLHGTANKPRGSMDHGLIYGDYYFVEALTLLCEPQLGTSLSQVYQRCQPVGTSRDTRTGRA
jgi:unsaturated chondroitin disaccharide hydrolase